MQSLNLLSVDAKVIATCHLLILFIYMHFEFAVHNL